MRHALLFLIAAVVAAAQTPCARPETFRPCELVLELTPEEMAAHPNPYLSLRLYAEIKSPRFKTFLLHAFQEKGNRFLIRFAPTEEGEWSWRLTSGLARWDGKTGAVTAVDSGRNGYIQPATVHHWNYPDKLKGHLWMGDNLERFAYMERAQMEAVIDKRASQKFNHVRGLVFSPVASEQGRPFRGADTPDLDFFRELDQRVGYITSLNITLDLVLGAARNQLAELFPTWQQRERYARYMIARYSAYDLTWQMVQEFETYKSGRELVKELGNVFKQHDPYNRPRTTHTLATSGAVSDDGWMNYILYNTPDYGLGVIEHQLLLRPQVNARFAEEDKVDAATFRKRLWNAAMSGQYPTYAHSNPSAQTLETPGVKAMQVWHDVMSTTRFWELEPYFGVDGGRALALIRDFGEEDREAVEYLVYVENPRLIEVEVIRHTYNVYWIDPATGERHGGKDAGKEWKGASFVAEPPTKDRDWVLHLSRDGKKNGLLRSYKFDSRPFLRQEVEPNSTRNPFTFVAPVGNELSLSRPAQFEVKLNRPTRGTRTMLYSWTAEVSTDGQGYRVVGTGEKGTLAIPADIAAKLPAVLNLRVTGMNAFGKIYQQDKVFRLVP